MGKQGDEERDISKRDALRDEERDTLVSVINTSVSQSLLHCKWRHSAMLQIQGAVPGPASSGFLANSVRIA